MFLPRYASLPPPPWLSSKIFVNCLLILSYFAFFLPSMSEVDLVEKKYKAKTTGENDKRKKVGVEKVGL